MDALLLLLLDSRSPSGGHNHSLGMESAVNGGLVRTFDDVAAFCHGRLLTSGRVAAAFAAAAARLPPAAVCGDAAGRHADVHPAAWPHTRPAHAVRGDAAGRHADAHPAAWPHTVAGLDAEFDARTPSEAVRAASRQLGRGLRRLAATMRPGVELPLAHHPIVLGRAVAAAGGTPVLAARAAALSTVSVPASAAVRLLGLDPFAVQGLLAELAREIDRLPVLDDLPADSAPALDLLADHHLTTEVRLFAS